MNTDGKQTTYPCSSVANNQLLLHNRRELFVLVGRNEIHAVRQGRLPSQHHGLARPEVVIVAPTAGISSGAETIQRIKTDPVAQAVRMVHQGAQAPLAGGGPIAGLMLPAFLHHVPGVVPPAAVIGGRAGEQLFRRRGGEQALVDRFGVRRSEQAQSAAYRDLVKENLFLIVVLLGENQQRLGIERRELVRIAALYGGGVPSIVLAQKIPHGAQQGCAVVLEIEMQHDQRPVRAIVLPQRLLDDGPHAFEEIIAQQRLGAGGFGSVRYHYAALVPSQILLNGDREASSQCAIDAVRPLALIRIAVVSIAKGMVVVQKLERGRLRRARGSRHNSKSRQSHFAPAILNAYAWRAGKL